MMNNNEAKNANIRLIILRALAADPDETLNSHLLQAELQRFMYQRSRGYIAEQLSWLELTGAVRVVRAGTEVIGQITEVGKDHLARRIRIDGIQWPSQALDLQ